MGQGIGGQAKGGQGQGQEGEEDKEKKEEEYDEEEDEEGIFGAFLHRGSPRLSQRSAAAGLNQNQDNLSHSTSQSRAAT